MANFCEILLLKGVVCHQPIHKNQLTINLRNMSSTSAPSGNNPPVEGADFEECYVRWQKLQRGQTALAARVTSPTWSQTTAQLNQTINNMGGGASNVPLWLQGGFEALQYAGLMTYSELGVNSQSGLNGDDVIASIILPSGVAKLNKVGADSRVVGQQNAKTTSMIFGIALKDPKKPLVPADYAYIKSKNAPGEKIEGGFKDVCKAKDAEVSKFKKTGKGPLPESQMHVSAIKGNGTTIGITIDVGLIVPVDPSAARR